MIGLGGFKKLLLPSLAAMFCLSLSAGAEGVLKKLDLALSRLGMGGIPSEFLLLVSTEEPI